jgi:hypothetical protein
MALRRNARERKEYLYRRSLAGAEAAAYEKKKKSFAKPFEKENQFPLN